MLKHHVLFFLSILTLTLASQRGSKGKGSKEKGVKWVVRSSTSVDKDAHPVEPLVDDASSSEAGLSNVGPQFTRTSQGLDPIVPFSIATRDRFLLPVTRPNQFGFQRNPPRLNEQSAVQGWVPWKGIGNPLPERPPLLNEPSPVRGWFPLDGLKYPLPRPPPLSIGRNFLYTKASQAQPLPPLLPSPRPSLFNDNDFPRLPRTSVSARSPPGFPPRPPQRN